MTLFDAFLLVANSAFAGAYLSHCTNIFVTLAGLFSAFAVFVSLVARFA